MPHFGTLRDFRFSGEHDADDIRGAKLYGRNDDKLGEIADVIFDHQTGDIRYAVVDTGGWFTHKQFLVPADRIQPRGSSDDEYRTNLNKDEIQNFPKFDPDAVSDNDRWGNYERDYHASSDKYFADSDVLHRADSDNIITPPDLPGRSVGGLGDVEIRPRHQFRDNEAGPMNTSPTAWGESMDRERLSVSPESSSTAPDLETTEDFARSRSGMNVSRRESIEQPVIERTEVVERPVIERTEVVEATRLNDDTGLAQGNQGTLNRGEAGYASVNQADLGAVDRGQGLNTTSFNNVEGPGADRSETVRLRRVEDEPFRNADVGGTTRQSDVLEKRYDQRNQELYDASRSEFLNARSARSGTEVPGNAPNTSDAEIRTAEGDSIYNVTDRQVGGNAPTPMQGVGAYESDSGVTPELRNIREQQESGSRMGERVSDRWSRFQNRLREERHNLTGHCEHCMHDQNKVA